MRAHLRVPGGVLEGHAPARHARSQRAAAAGPAGPELAERGHANHVGHDEQRLPVVG